MANLEQAVKKMEDDIAAFVDKHLYGQHTAGYYDAAYQCSVYFDGRNPKDRTKYKAFRSVLAGTGDPKEFDFIWAWGNKHLPQHFQEEALKLKEFGEKLKLPEFCERALFIDSKTEVGLAAAMTTRKGKRLSAGFDAQVVMDQGALHSRFSSVEFFALVTYVLKAKMSSILPIHGAGYCAYAFIVDDTPLPMG